MSSLKVKVFICFSVLTSIVFMMNACGDFQSVSLNQGSSDLFNEAKTVLQKNCMSCHGVNGSASSFDLNSTEDFIRAGFIVPGKPGESKLIYRVKNYEGDVSSSNNNMPPGSERMSDDAYQALYSWIVDLPSGTSPFQCDSDGQNLNTSQIGRADVKRLSIRQYRNTLIDLFSIAMSANQSRTLIDSILNDVYLPDDSGAIFRRENNSFSGAHLEGFFEIADELGEEISSSHLNSMVSRFINLNPGNCSAINVSNLSQVCKEQLVRNFASRAYRRPLRDSAAALSTTSNETIDEVSEFLNELSGVSTQVGVSTLIFKVLLSPHFLFQIEDQNLVQPDIRGPSIFRLNSFAIASRLSYRFWNTLPDEQLWNMALTEDLFETEAYLRAFNYVISQHDKLDDALREYFKDWLHLDSIPNFSVSPRFALINNTATFDESLRTSMISEVEELGSYIVTSGGSFEDLFTTDVSFARDSDLMTLYNITTQAPQNINTSNAVRFPAGQRAGLLTRAALLISGSELASPILRGAHLRKDILCLNLGAPPANALEEFENVSVPHHYSTRDKVNIKTSGPACVGCHNLINPLGFGLSNYNSFGMFINQEPIFSETDNSIDTYASIDSSVDLSNLFGPGASADGAQELSELIARQQTAKVCFAEKFMSYSFAREADRETDACRLEKIYNNLGAGGRLIDMVRATGLDVEFRLRKIDD